MKAQINELVEEELGSRTKEKKDDFKIAVEEFADRMKLITQEINNLVKSCQ